MDSSPSMTWWMIFTNAENKSLEIDLPTEVQNLFHLTSVFHHLMNSRILLFWIGELEFYWNSKACNLIHPNHRTGQWRTGSTGKAAHTLFHSMYGIFTYIWAVSGDKCRLNIPIHWAFGIHQQKKDGYWTFPVGTFQLNPYIFFCQNTMAVRVRSKISLDAFTWQVVPDDQQIRPS